MADLLKIFKRQKGLRIVKLVKLAKCVSNYLLRLIGVVIPEQVSEDREMVSAWKHFMEASDQDLSDVETSQVAQDFSEMQENSSQATFQSIQVIQGKP
eukprot:768568-Hanusia_phi.AAC.8